MLEVRKMCHRFVLKLLIANPHMVNLSCSFLLIALSYYFSKCYKSSFLKMPKRSLKRWTSLRLTSNNIPLFKIAVTGAIICIPYSGFRIFKSHIIRLGNLIVIVPLIFRISCTLRSIFQYLVQNIVS